MDLFFYMDNFYSRCSLRSSTLTHHLLAYPMICSCRREIRDDRLRDTL